MLATYKRIASLNVDTSILVCQALHTRGACNVRAELHALKRDVRDRCHMTSANVITVRGWRLYLGRRLQWLEGRMA